jgi:hypothetical protein
MLVGLAVVGVGLVALRPVFEKVELNARLIVAQQYLASYRFAVLSYCGQFQGNLPDDVFERAFQRAAEQEEEEAEGKATAAGAPDKYEVTLGHWLVQSRKIDRVSFPLGGSRPAKAPPPEEGTITETRIWAVFLPDLEKHFNRYNLFPSARSSKVALLVVPYLTKRQSEGLQKMISEQQLKAEDGEKDHVGDCFFTRSDVEGMFTGWLYLSDL